MSLKRILLPYMGVAALLTFGSYLLNAWVIPITDKARVRFENTYLRDYWSQAKSTIYRQLRPGEILYMEYFNNNDSTGGGVTIEKADNSRLQSVLFAQNINYNYQAKKWRLQRVKVRIFNPDGSQNLELIENLDTALAITPSDFFFRPEDVQSLNMGELKAFIAKEKERGAERIEFYETELHRRYAAPFSTFILSFIGVCVAGRRVRGGLGLHLGIGIFIIIFYLFVSKYFISMGSTNLLHPILSVWITNVVFAGIGLVLYRFAQK